jgi:peptide/nickel transport system permease protein
MTTDSALEIPFELTPARKGRPNRIAAGFHALRRKPLGAFGLALVVFVVLWSAAAPITAPNDPNAIGRSLAEANRGPSLDHPFGTDGQARDQYSRVVWGARLSLFVGIGAMVVAVGAGTAVGLVSGFFGGVVDLLIQRIVDGVMAFPGLLLLMLLVTVSEPSALTVTWALGFLFTASVSRVVRSAVLPAKQEVYVDAARVVGASNARLMLRHILPNVVAPIIVIFSIGIGAAMLAEASLSFLGLGTPPPDPSLGRMVSESRTLLARYPHLSIFPGLALSMAVLGFNLAGDALRDILDPRLRI